MIARGIERYLAQKPHTFVENRKSVSFARGREFEPRRRHKKRPHMEASSMLDKSFCAKPDKWVWPTTVLVVTQTHLSRIAQKSLSVLCRV